MLMKTSRRQIKIFQLLNTLKPLRKPSRQNDECYWSVCKKQKKMRIFCFQKHCNLQSSSKCPGLTINTVMKEGAKGKKKPSVFPSYLYIFPSHYSLCGLLHHTPLAILCSAWGMDANVQFFCQSFSRIFKSDLSKVMRRFQEF